MRNKLKRGIVLVSIIVFSLLIPFIFAETETPIGTFTVGNAAPNAPYNWNPTTTHNKSENFTWTEGSDDNGDPVSNYVCISADTDDDSCDVVATGLLADPYYNFTQSESNWDYTWGTASRNYYVKLTPNDGTENGTVNDTISFTLTDALPTITGQTSDASSDGDKDVGETITFSMTSHGDTDANDNHSVRICITDSINTSGECPGGEYCNEHNSTYSDDASLACTYTAQQSDGSSNTAYFFVCDCPPNDNTCPGQCSASSSHTFYVNHAPSASSVDILPNAPSSAQDLNCSYTFSDTDGDSEGSSTYKWFNWTGSAWNDVGINSKILGAGNTSNGETWMCEVTPIDEHAFAGSAVNSTNETMGNAAPDQPTTFTIQDGASSFDSSSLDTHDVTPNINWSTFDNDGDPVTTYVCIATSGANRDANNCDLNYTETTTDSVTAVSGLSYSGTSVTYYIRLTPNDGSENGTALDTQFDILNAFPNTPSGLSPTITHNQTPSLSWTATDPDDGSVDGWPADTLTHYIRVGTSYGDATYEDNTDANNAGEVVDNPIPWGSPSGDYANNTVYSSIWSTDGNGGTSAYYNTTIVLYDYLPNITNVQMTDDGSAYSSCTSASCALSPIEHTNSTVAVEITATDTDNDCDVGGNSAAYMHLCIFTSGTCDETAYNYSWQVDSVARSGSTCTYTFSTNKTASDSTPEFFRLPNSSYKLHVNVSSQGGERSSDAEQDANWTFGTLKAIDYPTVVTLGDGSPTLGQWNNGTNLSTMTNWGNDNLNIQWNMSDPDSGSDTWTLNGTDVQIDDDTGLTTETSGYLSPVNINSTQNTFEPGTGLEVCSSASCDDASLNETLATYYHISPPLGLLAGVYNSTITIQIS
ncbi:hypothetical protein KY342_01825 [Candidatus Woesearchaeota archaeon]|nr:hypothetical protein [Candidatus Woesearchaeota archaeon]